MSGWAAAVVGPAGLVVGFLLSEISEARRSARTRRERAVADSEARVAAVVRHARRATGEFRGLAHGASIRRKDAEQFSSAVTAFNDNWRELETALAEAAVLGPDWIDGPASELLAVGSNGMGTIMRMQRALTASDVTLVQRQIAEMDSALNAVLLTARINLRPEAPESRIMSVDLDAARKLGGDNQIVDTAD